MSNDNDNVQGEAHRQRSLAGINLIDDCWLQALSFLGVRGLCKAQLCSKHLSFLANFNLLWKLLFEKEFPSSSLLSIKDEQDSVENTETHNWKQNYKTQFLTFLQWSLQRKHSDLIVSPNGKRVDLKDRDYASYLPSIMTSRPLPLGRIVKTIVQNNNNSESNSNSKSDKSSSQVEWHALTFEILVNDHSPYFLVAFGICDIDGDLKGMWTSPKNCYLYTSGGSLYHCGKVVKCYSKTIKNGDLFGFLLERPSTNPNSDANANNNGDDTDMCGFISFYINGKRVSDRMKLSKEESQTPLYASAMLVQIDQTLTIQDKPSFQHPHGTIQ